MQSYLTLFTNKTLSFGNSRERHKKEFKEEMKKLNAPCIYCGGEIDYFAKNDANNSFTVEHVIPQACKTEGRNTAKNFAAAHWLCNEKRKATDSSDVIKNSETLKHIKEYIEFFKGKIVCQLENYSEIIKKNYAI